ncbi:MAG: diacylglycerol/lipid kinase family protein [Actinomycetes bacterium]
MSTDAAVVVGVVVALLLVAGLFAAVAVRGRRWADSAAPAEPEPFAPDPDARPRAAVVVNPTKFDGGTDDMRRQVEVACAEAGWATPLWLETTEDDPGVGQTRQALADGVDVVVACGGDGTVRTVGETLAGTGTPLGLLPAGTGNLLARNLDTDVTDVPRSMRIALTGRSRPVDVGWVTVVGPHGEEHTRPEEQAFLVMAGMGFDAAIMANAPEALKAKVGPIAYAISGLRQLRGQQARVRLQVDDEVVTRRVRTVVVGNCGRLLGGLVLMPDAEVDDGWLDVVTISPKGVVGWAAVAGRVITRRRRGHPRVEHWRARELSIRAETPQPAQLDGDPVGDAVELRMRVDPGALLVRVPDAAEGQP